MKEKVYIIDGKEVVLVSPDSYERTLRELERNLKPNEIPYRTRIFDAIQVVVEKAKNPSFRTGQYYFYVKTIDGKEPPKRRN